MTRGAWIAAAAACLLLALAPTPALGDCVPGAASCWCKELGGEWQSPMSYRDNTNMLRGIPGACRLFYDYGGRKRWVNVYFPKGYTRDYKFPLWIQLHGVFWSTMDNISQRVGRGRPLDGTDIIPHWDRTVDLFGDKAIIAYPQSTGDPGTGDPAKDGPTIKRKQFWNTKFWRCSVGTCVDDSADDVSFLSYVIQDLPKKLRSKPGELLLAGQSAGGMMLQTLMCEAPEVMESATAVVDLLGGVGKDYMMGPSCRRGVKVPFMKIQGEKDPFIPYDRELLVDGVNFIDAVSLTKLRAARIGCGTGDWGQRRPAFDGKLMCQDFCAGRPQAPTQRMCSIPGVGHDTDHPWPGFVFQMAWRFFNEQADKKRAMAQRRPMRPGL